MEKRVVFRSAWLPYAFVAPQIAITILFFFWPALQAGWYAFQLQDAFGERTQFVGFANFAALLSDSNYLHSFRVTAVFSALVAASGLTIALILAIGRRFRESQASMQAGDWSILMGSDLYRKTVGVVGAGRIGRSVVQRLRGFEAEVAGRQL